VTNGELDGTIRTAISSKEKIEHLKIGVVPNAGLIKHMPDFMKMGIGIIAGGNMTKNGIVINVIVSISQIR
jgi:hypothetical protein